METTADIKNEIEKLVAEINEHNYRYYVLDAPIVSDEEYDRLFKRLKDLEEEFGYIPVDSPTQRVGAASPQPRHLHLAARLSMAAGHDRLRTALFALSELRGCRV